MGSIAGRQAYPGGASYIASKFAVRGFSYALREDLLGRPIRITTVDAGLVETEFSVVRFRGDQERRRRGVRGRRPGHPGRGRRLRDVRAHAARAREPRRDRDQGDRAVVRRTRRAPRRADAPCSLRSPYDRQILRFAIPALGTLAAEPLYVLVDTAIVGHLGRSQLAALGVAATVLSVLAMFNFLQYGTTAQVARATGAGEDLTAARLGAQALWLSLAFGCALAVAVVAARRAGRRSRSASRATTAAYAVTYLRIAALGIPSAFLAIGGQGFLRGVSDLRTPLLIVIAGNVVNVVLEVWLVYGLDLGIEGSAWGTVDRADRHGHRDGRRDPAARRSRERRLRPALARRLLSLGKFIFIRTASLIASFVLAGAVVARLGDAPLAAYQIAFQLWIFLALVLDAIAIAGQIIVGQELGASRPDDAFAASVRMIWLSFATGAVFAVVLLALGGVIPRIFTSDAEVLAQCALLWPIFALMQPLNGVVFALDGILIGASDGRYLALSMAAAFVACAGALAVAAWARRRVCAASGPRSRVLIVTRLVLMGARFLRRRWLVTGFA